MSQKELPLPGPPAGANVLIKRIYRCRCNIENVKELIPCLTHKFQDVHVGVIKIL